MMDLCEVIDKRPDGRYLVFMQDYLNTEHMNSIRKDLAKKNDIKENNKLIKILMDTENKYVIQ